MNDFLGAIERQVSTEKLAQWQPPLSGDLDMLINRRGEWIHEGAMIQREALVRLFASVLRREDDGCYYLVSPVEKWRIEVEEEPFIVTMMDITSQAHNKMLSFETNVGHRIQLTELGQLRFLPQSDGGEIPSLGLPHGLTAKMARSVYYQFCQQIEERDGEFGVWSDNKWFPVALAVMD